MGSLLTGCVFGTFLLLLPGIGKRKCYLIENFIKIVYKEIRRLINEFSKQDEEFLQTKHTTRHFAIESIKENFHSK